jgi:hypothetical protein
MLILATQTDWWGRSPGQLPRGHDRVKHSARSKMMPARRLHAGDRRRWRLRPPRDVRIGELETSDDHEPTSAGADRKGPQERRRRRHTTAVNSGELRNKATDCEMKM